jgi:hypothetical protein
MQLFMLKSGPFCRRRCSSSGSLASSPFYVNFYLVFGTRAGSEIPILKGLVRRIKSVHNTAHKLEFFAHFGPKRTRKFFIIFRLWYFSLHYCIVVKIFFLRRGPLLLYRFTGLAGSSSCFFS